VDGNDRHLGRSLGLGVILSGVNPKNLALAIAASASIAQAGLDGGQSAIAVAAFVVLASATVVGPVVLAVVAPTKSSGMLATTKTFMRTNNAVIMLVLFFVLGAKLIGDGLSGLAS
jgi:threonine/homoserine/homoserine lactone efflux protein